MRVISNTTKGKNDRIALAATENANVCTSVRSKYFRVELANPEYCGVSLPGTLTFATTWLSALL